MKNLKIMFVEFMMELLKCLKLIGNANCFKRLIEFNYCIKNWKRVCQKQFNYLNLQHFSMFCGLCMNYVWNKFHMLYH